MSILGSAGRSGADRTLDRAVAAQESAARAKRVLPRTVSTTVSVTLRWRGRALLAAPPPGREPRADRDHLPRLSRSGSRSSPAPTEPTRRLCHQGPYWSARDLQ